MNSLITILMTCYNSELYIKIAIESIINQTYENWELIIVDDNSTDKTHEILNNYINNDKITIIKNPMNYGTYFSLNEALKISKGDYITKLDSDDAYDKNKLKNQLNFCLENNLEACTCNILRGYYNNGKVIYQKEANDSSIMFSRNVFNTIGYFDNARFDCDSEYFYRLKKYFTINNLDENLYYARYRNNSLTSSYDSGTNIKHTGSNIRKIYKVNYKKYNPKYIYHPKYTRNFYIHPYQRTPAELEINGKYNIINESDNSVKIEFLTKAEIINIYKIIPEQNIKIKLKDNINYNIYIKNLENEDIKYIKTSNNIEFKTNYKYIKIIREFNIGIYECYPLILSN